MNTGEEKKNNGNCGQSRVIINARNIGIVNSGSSRVDTTIIIGSDDDKMLIREVADESSTAKKGSRTFRELLQKGLVKTDSYKQEITSYVNNILPLVKEKKRQTFKTLWQRIFEHEAFSTVIYDHGKQLKSFNRNLVANIIFYLDRKEFYKDNYNSSAMARTLEDSDVEADRVRKALGIEPDKKYCEAIDSILKEINE